MGIIDFIFPRTCIGCGTDGRYICDECLDKVGGGIVKNDRVAIFKYEGVIRKSIIALKYKYSLDIATELASICSKKLKNTSFKKQVLVPVPLYWHRENVRGFNQTFEVGKRISKMMGWRYLENLVIREKGTKPQVGLSGYDRLRNICGVFAVNNSLKISKNTNLLIFDDVYTTGATVGEIKNILKGSGFRNVQVLTIAS